MDDDDVEYPEDEPPFLSRVKLVPALQGAVVAFFLAMALGFLVGVVGLICVFVIKATPESIEAFAQSPTTMVLGLVVSLIPPLVGGYFTARAAGEFEVENGATAGAFYVLFSLMLVLPFSGASGLSELLEWQSLLHNGLAIPAAIAGAVLRRHVVVF